MKYLLMLLFTGGIICLSTEKAEAQQAEVLLSDALDSGNLHVLYPSLTAFEKITKALEATTQFLKEKDLSMIAGDSLQTKEAFKLADRQMPQFTKYELTAAIYNTDGSVSITVVAYTWFKQAHIQQFNGLFRIDYTHAGTIRFPLESLSCFTITTPQVEFRSANTLQKEKTVQTCQFMQSLTTRLQAAYPSFVLPDFQLRYIISDNPFSGIPCWNMDHFLVTAQYLPKIHTLIDVGTGGYYPHELVHYLTAAYPLNGFVNEAIATWLSHGQLSYRNDAIAEWEQIVQRLKKDAAYRDQLDSDKLLSAALGPEMYLTGALLLQDYAHQFGEPALFSLLLDTSLSMDSLASLALFKKQLTIQHISTYLENSRARVLQLMKP